MTTLFSRHVYLRSSVPGIVAVLVAFVVMTVATVSTATASTEGADPLKAGVAREIITPKLGGLFLGYGSPRGSTAVHDDLTVTALTLEQGKTRVVLMSVTLCIIGNDLCAKLRELCGEAAGVPASHVIVAATHTHSGPITASFDLDVDTEYIDEILIPKSIAAVKASVQGMKLTTMGVATTNTLVGINRRQLLPNNRVILGQNRWGIYDPEMTVISFRGEDGKSFANIVHCTAHCTAIGNSPNTEVSRDWAGTMIDRLDQETGAITMFFNGMQGDVSPRMANGRSTGSGMADAIEVGAMAGLDAVRAYKDIRVYRNEDVVVATGQVRLPHAPIMPLEEAKQELAKIEAAAPSRFSTGRKNLLTKVIELHSKGETGESHFVYDQTLVRVGSVVFVPVPFEAFSEISLRLRDYSKFGHTLALGCTNGGNNYLPSQDQIVRGGYEIDMWMWSAPRRVAENADVHLINENIKLMEGL